MIANVDVVCRMNVLEKNMWGQICGYRPRESIRFWFKACTRMDVLEAASTVCTKKFGNKVNQVDCMDASQVYMKIVKFLPSETR